MDKEMQNSSLRIEHGPEGSAGGGISKNLDDDGRQKRTGTWITASAHIITAVIGSGVLSLAWAIAQLGWVVGPLVLVVFSFITFFTSTLLADSYRSPDPVTGNRNYTYMDAVRAHLGGRKVQLCGLAQYVNLIGITIGYTITASISMVAVRRSNCFHKHGHAVKCQTSNNPYMIIFACIQIMLSQIPNFHRLSWLSILAAVMSFAYASIGLGLSLAKVIGGGAHARTSLTGVTVGVDVQSPIQFRTKLEALAMAISKLFIVSLVASLLVFHLVEADQKVNSNQATGYTPGKNIDCGGACNVRCSLSSRPRLCKRACGTCCTRCNCVPQGTSGNLDTCPCYATMTTRGGRRKCP